MPSSFNWLLFAAAGAYHAADPGTYHAAEAWAYHAADPGRRLTWSSPLGASSSSVWRRRARS